MEKVEENQFPKEDEFILDKYKNEIILRAEWTQLFLLDGELAEEAEEKFRHYTSAIIYAMSISRMLNYFTSRARTPEREIAKQRVKEIKKKWPEIPNPPKTLREVRNRIEHFEEWMDEWAVTDKSRIFIDSNVGFGNGGIVVDGMEETKALRSIDDKGAFVIFGEKVHFQEIEKWCIELVEYLKENK